MSFTVDDYHDLVRLVQQHPEWKSELRQLLLSDELLELPGLVSKLTVSHERAEERLTKTNKRFTRTEEQLSEVEERLTRLESTVQKLAEQVAKLAEVQRTMVNDIGALKGRMLEQTYRVKAGAYFGPLLRRMRLVEPHTLEDTLEDRLTAGEFRDVLRLDLLASGEPRRHSDAAEIWLAVEVSSVIDQHDVDRTERRAILLRKAGYCAVPVVAGENATQGAEVDCEDQNVLMLQDGSIKFWREAFSVWTNQ